MLDEAAIAETGEPLGLTNADLSTALDPRVIIESRKGTGGAAPAAVTSMIARCEHQADDLAAAVQRRRQLLEEAERRLLERARITAGVGEDPDD
jgi:hypothetical protein